MYKRDKVEDLSRQRTVGTGPGYQFWDNELGAFSLGSLINRTDYQFSDGSKENFYSVAMKWDYNRYLIGKKVDSSPMARWASRCRAWPSTRWMPRWAYVTR